MTERRSAASVVRRYRLPSFFVLTFAISRTLWLGLAAVALPITTTTGAVLNIIAIAGPSIAAVMLTIRLVSFVSCSPASLPRDCRSAGRPSH